MTRRALESNPRFALASRVEKTRARCATKDSMSHVAAIPYGWIDRLGGAEESYASSFYLECCSAGMPEVSTIALDGRFDTLFSHVIFWMLQESSNVRQRVWKHYSQCDSTPCLLKLFLERYKNRLRHTKLRRGFLYYIIFLLL